MQPQTAVQAPIPSMPLQSKAILPDNKSRAQSRFVFFAGDVITPSEKYQQPSRSLGGVDLDMYRTLSESGKELYLRPELTDAGGVLHRGAITELRSFYVPVNRNMVAPAALPGSTEADGRYKPGYIKPNGRFNASTGQYEDIYVGGPASNCVYFEIFPGDEIHRITQASNDLKPNGIVEIAALSGQDAAVKHEMQLYYFPNWAELQLQLAEFPARLKTLRSQLLRKIEEAGVGTLHRPVGAQMVRSCDEFRLWGMRYLKAWRKIVKIGESEIDAPISGYNDLAEMLFEMLEVNREDTLSQAAVANDTVNQLAEVLMSRLSPAAAAPAADAQPFDPSSPALQAYIQEQIRLAMQAVAATPEAEQTQEPTNPNVGLAADELRDVVLTKDQEEADNTAAAVNTFTLGETATLVADGRQGEVVWKGPGKVKLKFEDGSTLVVATTDAIPAAPPEG